MANTNTNVVVSFENLVPEILQRIAFFAADLSPGPPSNVLSLLLTSRTIYSAIDFDDHPYLYDRIFRLKFDIQAPQRRLGTRIMKSSIVANELRIRCRMLQRIHQCRIDTSLEFIANDLWIAYLMMLESEGRNEIQLIDYANIRRFIYIFLHFRLNEGSEMNNGWPVENEANALAVWLLWLVNDAKSISEELPNTRATILSLLRPFVVSDFKYQPFFVPDIHFYLPLTGNPNTNPPRSSHTLHGPYPIYRPILLPSTSNPKPTLKYFGISLILASPPLAPAALLATFVRLELNKIEPPPGCPERREELGDGESGITMQDCRDFNENAKTRCVVRRVVRGSVGFVDEDEGWDEEDEDFATISNSAFGMAFDGDGSKKKDWRPSPNPSLDPTPAKTLLMRSEYSGVNVNVNGSDHDDDKSDKKSLLTNQEIARDMAASNVKSVSEIRSPKMLGRIARLFSSFDHEHEWLRLVHCHNPWLDAKIKIRIFTPGMLDGCWEGRFFAYDFADYTALLSTTQMPTNLHEFPFCVQMPMQMTLREHHCLPPNLPFPCGGDGCGVDGDGLRNAYFGSGMEMGERNGSLILTDTETSEKTVYETYNSGRPNSHSLNGGCKLCRPSNSDTLSSDDISRYENIFAKEGLGLEQTKEDSEWWEDTVENGCIKDIVVTGETDFTHGRAWGFYKFYGRIRDADGLIVILRIPNGFNNTGSGTQIFRGYIHSKQNFCGRWRSAINPPELLSAHTGTFTMSKRLS